MRFLFIIFIFIFGRIVSQIPPGYYNSAQGLTGNNLKIALHNIIKNHTIVPYSGLWTAFSSTDKKANGKVWDIYSHNPAGAQPYEYTFVSNQCGSYNSEADCYNREHSWPQSWFNANAGPDSDLFHIYPTDGYVNGQRSNYPYGNVTSPSWTSMNGGKLGPCINVGYGSTVFEPINEYKGDLARTYFYMTTRYYSEDASWAASGATNKADILPWQMTVLLSWHNQDPVSAKEIARNDSIYKLQNNRNPFIDHPEWVDSTWLTATAIFENEKNKINAFKLYPNPSENKFFVFSQAGKSAKSNCTVTTLSGKIILEKEILINDEGIDCSSWANGVYIICINNGENISRMRFVKL